MQTDYQRRKQLIFNEMLETLRNKQRESSSDEVRAALRFGSSEGSCAALDGSRFAFSVGVSRSGVRIGSQQWLLAASCSLC